MAGNGNARQVVMKRNPLEGSPACCGVCGDVCEPKAVDLFIEGTMIPVCEGCGETEAPELSNIMHGRPWWVREGRPQPGNLVDPLEQVDGPLYECEACGARWEFAGPCPEKCPTCGKGTLALWAGWGDTEQEGDAGNEPIPF